MTMFHKIILLVYLATNLQTTRTAPCHSLNRFVSCYELVTINISNFASVSDAFSSHSHRMQKSNSSATEMRIEFTAFGHFFRLRLHPAPADFSLLPSSAVVRVYTDSSVETYRRDELDRSLYVGYDASEFAPSRVQAMIATDGALQGVIFTTDGDTFYLEPAADYLQGITGHRQSVIYRRQDVNGPLFGGSHNRSLCSNRLFNASARNSTPVHARQRRADHLSLGLTCHLCIIIDHTYYANVANKDRNVAVSKVVQHIAEADHIFRGTDFNDDGFQDNIGFTITEVHIYSSPQAFDYKLRDTTTTLNSLHDALSKYNFDEFCLAVALTFRDFGSGIIGLSVTPSLPTKKSAGSVGGICERHRHVGYEMRLKPDYYSLNTAIISQLSNGERLVDAVTALTIAHEIGHSFGARHDEELKEFAECLPGDKTVHGNYLMSAQVSSHPKKAHNWMFSSCSLKHMLPIINTKGHCLQQQHVPRCGNTIVEDDEECDCGTTYSCEFIDKCCIPNEIVRYWYDVKPRPCMLTGHCSPRVNLCCTENCSIAPRDTICRPPTDCTAESRCDGISPSCPMPVISRNNLPCGNGMGTCNAGVCSTSICELNGMRDCQCSSPLFHRCSVCCQCATRRGACLPAKWLALNRGKSALHLLPNAPCIGGVCNTEMKCIIHLRSLLKFNNIPETFSNDYYTGGANVETTEQQPTESEHQLHLDNNEDFVDV